MTKNTKWLLFFSVIGVLLLSVHLAHQYQNRSEYLTGARYWLKQSQTDKLAAQVELDIKILKEYVEKANVDLVYLGTSEKKLADIQKNSYIFTAKHYLALAHKEESVGEVLVDIIIFKKNTIKANLNFAYFGTSEKKLAALIQEAILREKNLNLNKDKILQYQI